MAQADTGTSTIKFYGPHFIVSSNGKLLQLPVSDTVSVALQPFHGGRNQQWIIQDDGDGEVAIMSKYNRTYVTHGSLLEDASLISTSVPFYWEISREGVAYKLTVPDSEFGLSLDISAKLRPLSEAQEMSFFIIRNTPENKVLIKSGRILAAATTDPASSTVNHGGPNINMTVNELSGTPADTVNAIQNIIAFNGDKNLNIFWGGHNPMDSPIPKSIRIPPSFLGLPSTYNVVTSLSGQECTGFPDRCFRIRRAGFPSTQYLSLSNANADDGNSFCLSSQFSDVSNRPSQIFFINSKGELCCNGGYVDVMDNVLIIAHNRAPTLPWPNPWSHPLPTFFYSKENRTISVKFYADPTVSLQWPRSEEDWNREYVITSGPGIVITVPSLSMVARWAVAKESVTWTSRGGIRYEDDYEGSVGVVEKDSIENSGHIERTQWDIELV